MGWEMKHICCVCKVLVREDDTPSPIPGLDSHTYCGPCVERELKLTGIEMIPDREIKGEYYYNNAHMPSRI